MDSVYIHVRVTAVFGIAFLVLVALLLRGRSWARPEAILAGAVLALLVAR